jgi:hypothetical protein
MAANDSTPNQANRQDSQNFDIDIDKMYSDFISSIDKVRSHCNTNNIRDNSVVNAIGSLPANNATLLDLKTKLNILCSVESTPQESRCHAFFRIIGFPCCDSSKSKIFNPGYDIIKNSSRSVNDTYKIGVIKDPLEGFRDLSVTRETFYIDNLKTFSAQESIDAATLALSSGRNIRQFISPLINTQFDDTEVSTYHIDVMSSVGGTQKPLDKYQDVFGNYPTKIGTFGPFNFIHVIKPFLVDPIIDLMINDSSKKIAVPFAPTKSELKVVNDTYVSRPMLEQVIRDRFSIVNPAETSGTADAAVLDYIKSIPNINDVEIINNAANLYKLGDQTQFIKFLNIIRAMVKKLVEAQDTIRKTQDKYYWVPAPAKNGPEGGCSVQGVFVSSNLDSDLITAADQVVINALIKTAIIQADALAATANATPDVGGFALPNALGLPNLGASTTPDSLGNDVVKNYKQVVAIRDEELKAAGAALQTVEIIMGEFSGLGLCDIVAVLGGLYLMPRNSLLGFLDYDAVTRMAEAEIITSDNSVDLFPGLSLASNDFINVVKDLYNLMDKIYQDLSENNGNA